MCLHPSQLGGAGLEVTVGIDDQGAGQRHCWALNTLVAGKKHVAPCCEPLGVRSITMHLTPSIVRQILS
jgi:hypothetical protein